MFELSLRLLYGFGKERNKITRTFKSLDENENVWFLLHSGLRCVGNRFSTFFIELAKNDMRQWIISLPDKDLAYLPQGTEHFED